MGGEGIVGYSMKAGYLIVHMKGGYVGFEVFIPLLGNANLHES